MRMKSFVLGICLVALAASWVGAGETSTQTAPASVKQVTANRLDGKIELDGRLSEPEWRDDLAAKVFVQSEPVEGVAPTERTLVDIVYDDEAIYVGARMYDADAKAIVARLGRRDASVTSDKFIFFVDPYHDRRTGFYFGLNAAGTQYDGTLLNDTWDDSSWDGVWEGTVRRDDEGWTAEMRIPYSQLRFQRGDTHVWGVNFKREIARKNEADYLVYTPRTENGFVSRFAELVGIGNIVPPRRIEITPYLTAKAEYAQAEEGDPFNDGSRFAPGVGLDLKAGLGSNLTLDATVNPDFGQVEVDPAVVNLSDVESFFEEKRPFFIEGSSIFNFGRGGATSYWGFNWGGPDFFYTRRIGRRPQGSAPDADWVDSPAGTNILGAAKLTGKFGGNLSVGILQAFTGRETARLDLAGVRSEAEVEPPAYHGVVRVEREFNDGRQGLGLMSTVTARSFGDDRLRDEINSSSLAFGVDGWTFVDGEKTWVVNGWTGVSDVRGNAERITSVQESSLHYFQRPDASHVEVDPDATSLKGIAGRLTLNKEKGNVIFNSAVGFISPGFDVNDSGYQWRSDQINGHIAAGYRWTNPGRVTRRMNHTFAAFQTRDFEGNAVSTGLGYMGFAQFLNYYTANWSVFYNPESTNNTRTRGGPLTINPPGYELYLFVYSDDRKPWVLGAGSGAYTSDSYRSRSVDASIEWKPASNLAVIASPGYVAETARAQWVDAFDDPLATNTYAKRYVFATIDQKTFSAGLRLNWTFTPKLSLQLYAQPLIASGDYHDYKELARARSFEFNNYAEENIAIDDGTYTIDPDGSGSAPAFSFSEPDFNYRSLRGNAVVRWEYRPGSTMYLVWTQSRSDVESIGDFRFGHSVGRLLGAKADNIFLLKFSYYWNP